MLERSRKEEAPEMSLGGSRGVLVGVLRGGNSLHVGGWVRPGEVLWE